jgi:hypothetical protein
MPPDRGARGRRGREAAAVESGAAAQLPVGRHLAVDERGVGMRVTWRLDHGFVNLSLWRAEQCVETFHLTPAAAAELVGFLARGLADATTVAAMAQLASLDAARAREPSLADRVTAAARRTRARAASALGRAADRIDP